MNRNIVCVLDNLRSRENVGSIFRTSDGAGVSKLYLCGTTPCPPHEKISKTALGAEEIVLWEYNKQIWRVIDRLKKEGYEIIGIEKTGQAKDVSSYKYHKPVALIFGNEVEGIGRNIIDKCDRVLSIPMQGQKESLNVSVAFGVAVYLIVGK